LKERRVKGTPVHGYRSKIMHSLAPPLHLYTRKEIKYVTRFWRLLKYIVFRFLPVLEKQIRAFSVGYFLIKEKV